MNLQLIAGVVGILIHIPLLIGVWSGKIHQSFTSYALWSALDFIAAYSIYLQGGNFWLPFLYAIGAGSTSISLLIKKYFSWSKVDSIVVILVIICVVIQYQIGPFSAMIASVLSLTIASVPQAIDTYKNPKNTPTLIYVVFSLASLISLLGAKSFALEQTLYATSALVCCVTITLFSLRKNPKYIEFD